MANDTMISTQSKHEKIFVEIKERILDGKLGPGDPLPSQADFMQEYDVALGTVRQALGRLQTEGLVISKRGKGSFVRARGVDWKVNSTSTAVGLVAFGPADAAEYEHLMQMQATLAQASLKVLIGFFAPSQLAPAMEWARPLAGVMAWGRPPQTFIQQLTAEKIPAIMLGNMHEGECPKDVSHVNFNLPAAVDQAVQYLKSLGHRRIVFVNRGGDDAANFPEFQKNLSTLFAQAVQRRLPDPCEELALDAGDVKRLIAYLEAFDSPPTALFVEGGQRACSLLHELEKAGWSAPTRISVVAISPLKSKSFAIPGLSYVELPKDELLTRSAEVMIEILQERRVVRESISPRLHWGSTCRKIDGD